MKSTAAAIDPKKQETNQEPKADNQIVHHLLLDGLVTQEQINYSTRVLSKLQTQKSLIQVMKELGYVNDDAIKKALKNNGLSGKLGSVLFELGYITEEQLEMSLKIQSEQTEKKKLGDILIEKKIITETMLAEGLSYQLSIPYASLNEGIDQELFFKTSIKRYQDHLFVPVQKQGNDILIAFADPNDPESITAAKNGFGPNIKPAISAKTAILDTIKKYSLKKEIGKFSAGDESSIIKLVHYIITSAIDTNASDIHIEPLKNNFLIRFRQDGVLNTFKTFPLDIFSAFSNRLKILCDLDIAERRRHQGGRLNFKHEGRDLDLRVSIYATVFGENFVLRVLNRDSQLLKIDDVGFSPKMLERFKEEALLLPNGVILITGPTGSGKTTTVYSCINDLINPETKIITAEDPVEYIIEGISQCSINPKINLTYEETLRHIVRQDPDVIVIGEIRDKFSAEVAVHAALTGHKVLTTFHTDDTIGGLIRLLNMNIEAFLISSTVVSIVSQRLLRKVCSSCVQKHELSLLEIRRLGYIPEDISKFSFYKGKGCSQCNYTGYKGRIAVFELLIINEEIRDALIKMKPSHEIRKIAIESAELITLLEDAIYKATYGLTTVNEIFRCLPRLVKPKQIQEILRLQN